MTIKNQPGKSFSDDKLLEKDKLKIGIVVSEWNEKITNSLLQASLDTFIKYGFKKNQILIKWVPGSYELALGAQYLFEFATVDAVVCLGCIIKGETPHFHYISEASALTIAQLSLKYNRAVSFGVITAEAEQHALERAGGKVGNKGEEAAMAILKMLSLKDELKNENRRSLGFR